MYVYALAAKTMSKKYSGIKCDGVLGLTRIGKCPTCGARVERTHTDIFFPYCKYSCKRVMQKREEERTRMKIEKQQKKYEEQEQKAKEYQAEIRLWRKAQTESMLKKEKNIKVLIMAANARVEKCKSRLEEWKNKVINTEKNTNAHSSAVKRTREWKIKLRDAEMMLALLKERSVKNASNAAEAAGNSLKDAR